KKADERENPVAGRERRRDCVLGAQQPVYNPRLTPDLRREPATEDGDEAGRERQDSSPKKPARLLQSAAPAEEDTEPRDRKHDQSHSHHEAKAEERDYHGW